MNTSTQHHAAKTQPSTRQKIWSFIKRTIYLACCTSIFAMACDETETGAGCTLGSQIALELCKVARLLAPGMIVLAIYLTDKKYEH